MLYVLIVTGVLQISSPWWLWCKKM